MNKKKLLIILTTVFALVVLAIFLNSKEGGVDNTVVVKKGEIKEIVRVTGSVVPASDADLAFEVTGKVKNTYRDVGDLVNAGDVIVALDTDSLYAELLEAEANLDSSIANLNSVERGTRPEEISVARAKIDSTERKIVDAKFQLVDKIENIYTKTDDAVRNKVDQFITNPNTSPDLDFTLPNFTLEKNIEEGRKNTSLDLNILESISKSTTDDNHLEISSEVKRITNKITYFLSDVALAVNSLSPNSSLSEATIDSYKTDVLTARTNVNTAFSNLLIAEEKLRSLQSELEVLNRDMLLLLAGPTDEDLAKAKASVRQSEARVERIKAQMNKSLLYAPISGTITKQNAKNGQIISAGEAVTSIISTDSLEVESYIPEVDIGRVMVGDPVKMTLDAFSGDEFSGTLVYIDPAETIVDGVVNFKATISIDEGIEKFKSGLTANLYIETENKSDAIIVPQYTLLENDEGIFVERKIDDTKEKQKVTIGIRGEEGMVEVLEGLGEGDIIYNIGLRQ